MNAELIGARGTFGVELDEERYRGSTGEESRYRIVVWAGGSGSGPNAYIKDIEKARAIAKYLYETLLPEYEREEIEQAARVELIHLRMSAEGAQRRVEEKRKRRVALVKINDETPTVEKIRCDECEHLDDPEAFDEPAYECSRCGRIARGEDGRRCDQCNIFCAKLADRSCPSCEAALEDGTMVLGYEINGEFLTVGEVEHAKQGTAS